MTIDLIIQLLQNKLKSLANERDVAHTYGDLETLQRVEADILETQGTLEKIGTLNS